MSKDWLESVVGMLGPLRPAQLRRLERARELIELLGRGASQHEQWFVAASRAEGTSDLGSDEVDAISRALDAFDLDRGASGRPGALGEYVPGVTKISGSRKVLGEVGSGKATAAWVRLNHDSLEIGRGGKGKVYRFHRNGPKAVAELVWFEAVVLLSARTPRAFRERILLLLDSRGFRIATVENIPFRPDDLFQLARAADLPAAAYRVRCLEDQFEKIVDAMFPPRNDHGLRVRLWRT